MAEHHKENRLGSAVRACTCYNGKQCILDVMDEDERKKEKKQCSNTWENIPQDVLEMIMKRLRLKDFLRLRAVCRSWRVIVANAIANKHYPHPLPELPCILLFSNDASTIFKLRTDSELCQKSLVLNSSEQICFGTVDGWLIKSERVGMDMDSFAISFFNPVTNATILVSHVLKPPYEDPNMMFMNKIVASSEPNSSSKSDCSLVCLFSYYKRSGIAYCKLNDMSWNVIKVKKFRVWDVEIIGSKLYAIATRRTTQLKSILVYDLLQDSFSNPPKATVLGNLPPTPNPRITQSGTKRSVCGNITRYIAKDDDASGELFLIHLFSNFTYELKRVNDKTTKFVIPPKVTSFKVYMLDTKKKETTMKWKEVKYLGDRVLFFYLL